jgi:hypothetical protein
MRSSPGWPRTPSRRAARATVERACDDRTEDLPFATLKARHADCCAHDRMRAVLLVVLVGCYDPSLQPCAVRCEAASDCAGGLTCGADGWCASGDRLDRCELPDAARSTSDALAVDAPSPDAMIACAPGCNGSCETGVCVIRCSGPNACDMDVRCPATGPCRVECTGNRSCQKKIICGTGDCDVVCQGPDSCKDGVQCMNACACDVTCAGDACEKPATCRSPACDTGDGCTSTPATCDVCL